MDPPRVRVVVAEGWGWEAGTWLLESGREVGGVVIGKKVGPGRSRGEASMGVCRMKNVPRTNDSIRLGERPDISVKERFKFKIESRPHRIKRRGLEE